MVPGINVPVILIAGEAEPVSLKVTLSRLKNLLAPPLFQFNATVFQTLAVPSPTQVRFAPPAPPTMSLTALGVEVVSKVNVYRLWARGPATRKKFWLPDKELEVIRI